MDQEGRHHCLPEPKRDVVLVLQVDNSHGPERGTAGDRQIGVRSSPLFLWVVRRPVLKYPVTAAQLGTSDMVEIKFTADKTFVPALEASMKSGDPRELGARFFHVFVQ